MKIPLVKTICSRAVIELRQVYVQGCEQWGRVFASWRMYLRCYGGFSSIIVSPYFHIAVILTIIIAVFGNNCWKWYDDVKNIISCSLGFSFAAYSLLLGLSDDTFLQRLAGKNADGAPSPLMKVAGTFTHFFLVQGISLMYTVTIVSLELEKAFFTKHIGILLLMYSLLLLWATSLAALRFVSFYDYKSEFGKKTKKNSRCKRIYRCHSNINR